MTPTSKRPPIHHQKYQSNATATPEKYLANIVKHSTKHISNRAKTCCFSVCLVYFFTNAVHGPNTQRHRNKDKGQHIAQNGSTWAQYWHKMAQDKPNIKYQLWPSPHESTSAQHGATWLHISATCVHIGSTQHRPNRANNMTQHGPNIDQGGSTLAQHGLKRTQQQLNMARFFLNMSLR